MENFNLAAAIIEFASGTEVDWNSCQLPIPRNVLIYTTDTRILKRGDGITKYAELSTSIDINLIQNAPPPTLNYLSVLAPLDDDCIVIIDNELYDASSSTISSLVSRMASIENTEVMQSATLGTLGTSNDHVDTSISAADNGKLTIISSAKLSPSVLPSSIVPNNTGYSLIIIGMDVYSDINLNNRVYSLLDNTVYYVEIDGIHDIIDRDLLIFTLTSNAPSHVTISNLGRGKFSIAINNLDANTSIQFESSVTYGVDSVNKTYPIVVIDYASSTPYIGLPHITSIDVYSDQACTNQITSANEGSTVYCKIEAFHDTVQNDQLTYQLTASDHVGSIGVIAYNVFSVEIVNELSSDDSVLLTATVSYNSDTATSYLTFDINNIQLTAAYGLTSGDAGVAYVTSSGAIFLASSSDDHTMFSRFNSNLYNDDSDDNVRLNDFTVEDIASDNTNVYLAGKFSTSNYVIKIPNSTFLVPSSYSWLELSPGYLATIDSIIVSDNSNQGMVLTNDSTQNSAIAFYNGNNHLWNFNAGVKYEDATLSADNGYIFAVGRDLSAPSGLISILNITTGDITSKIFSNVSTLSAVAKLADGNIVCAGISTSNGYEYPFVAIVTQALQMVKYMELSGVTSQVSAVNSVSVSNDSIVICGSIKASPLKASAFVSEFTLSLDHTFSFFYHNSSLNNRADSISTDSDYMVVAGILEEAPSASHNSKYVLKVRGDAPATSLTGITIPELVYEPVSFAWLNSGVNLNNYTSSYTYVPNDLTVQQATPGTFTYQTFVDGAIDIVVEGLY